ncbi:hypothetical protein CDAR_487211 [Caerostris darwini]|uniref:Uncharacterized protein n=1 Tax=Caerostris darwini TaxID=1538125 RepID=A0AAV4UEY3_9ARAC|nr:hypothetical protein CDAR_487211 [Caerostris darwini]
MLPAFKEAEETDLAAEEGGQTREPQGAAVHRPEVPPCFVGAEAAAPGGDSSTGERCRREGCTGERPRPGCRWSSRRPASHSRSGRDCLENQYIIMFQDKFVAGQNNFYA